MFDTVEAETGVPRRDDETPREYLRRLGEHSSLPPEQVEALARTLEREAFSAGDADESRVREAAETFAESIDGDAARAALDAGESGAPRPDDTSLNRRAREADSGAERDDRAEDGSGAATAERGPGEQESNGPSGVDVEPTAPTDDEGSFRPPEQSEPDASADGSPDPGAETPRGAMGHPTESEGSDDPPAGETGSGDESGATERDTDGQDATGSVDEWTAPVASESSDGEPADGVGTESAGAAEGSGSGDTSSGASTGTDGEPADEQSLESVVPGESATESEERESEEPAPERREQRDSLSLGERAPGAITDAAWLARHAPVLVLALLVTTPIPTHQQATREVATSFQALAILRDGLGSYGYLTVRELPASLHLYSALTAPLVGAGYVEGGRLVSLLAAVGTALLAAAIANRLWGRVAALLAPALFWANAYAYRYAWAAMPEMFDAFLATAAVAATLRYTGDVGDGIAGTDIGPGNSRTWLALALGTLALATLNDVWAATMAVPVGAVLAVDGDRRAAVAAAATAVVATLAVVAVTGLQPPVPREGLSVAATGPGIYLSGAWIGHWIDRLVALPFYALHALHLFGGIAAAAWWLSRWRYDGADGRRRRIGVLLGTWTLAGLLPALAFPAGSLDGNAFYLVGATVPVTLSVAWLGSRAYARLAARRSPSVADRALRAAVAVVVVLALVNGAVVEGGLAGPVDSRLETAPFDVAEDEATEAGYRLREMDVGAGGVTFVGDWYTGEGAAVGGVAQVLVYANVLPRGVWLLGPDFESPDSPRFVDDASDADDCEVMVVHGGGPTASVEIRRC